MTGMVHVYLCNDDNWIRAGLYGVFAVDFNIKKKQIKFVFLSPSFTNKQNGIDLKYKKIGVFKYCLCTILLEFI